MATPINALVCTKQLIGTGLLPCEIKFQQPKTILRVTNDWTFDPATETFNLAYVISKIQDGTFTPFKNTLEFVENTPEPTRKEYQGGATATIRNGKPSHSYEYDNGIGFHAAAYSYNGFRQSSVILIDKAGNVGLQRNVAGTQIKAFATNDFNTRTYMMASGDETAKTIVEYQIDSEEAYNTRFTVITAKTIGADLNEEIDGIRSVTIEGTAEAGDPIAVTVMGVNNTIYGVEGLTAANFRLRNADTNAVLAITSIAAGATPGAYTITPTVATTAGLKVIVETYDDDANVATALVGDSTLYKGESEVITVAS